MNFLRKLIYYPIFFLGYYQQQLFSNTNKYSYISFRRLYGLTDGKLNESISKKISEKVGKYTLPSKTIGLLGNFDENKVANIVQTIRNNGFYVFKEKIPTEICNKLIDFAQNNPAETVPEKPGKEYIQYNSKDLHAPMYKFKEDDLLKNNEVRSILLDDNFFRIAQEYLQCKPINDIVAMWWSAPYSKEASSKAAQLYHFDMDHLKFIKFFIYLTDVDTENGPHCYVQGSHKSKPEALRDDKRYSDETIEKYYKPDEIFELTGPKGTVMAIDTSGLHKGKVVLSKERLIFQLEYTNNFFGQRVNKFVNSKSQFNNDQIQKLEQRSYSYQRFI